MHPLAHLLLAQGHKILGSDRSREQGKTPDKFTALESAGFKLFPQDGSGISKDIDYLVISSAIEDSIPDVKRAKELNITIKRRAEILADLFSCYKTSIAIAGTSGKSTTTGMIGVMLDGLGFNPSIMNGGVMRNYSSGMKIGGQDLFVSEVDESDGSIALFTPSIAVLNNIALDHKPIAELENLFSDFVKQARKGVVLNADDSRVSMLAGDASAPVLTFSVGAKADLSAQNLQFAQDGVKFNVIETKTNESMSIHLRVPGAHNVANAMATLATARLLAIPLGDAVKGLQNFQGISRRLEIVGTKNGITVIDDFGHNPDKIAATLKTLREFDGRLIVIFQPHGYGPLKLMGNEIAESFACCLKRGDLLLMPEVYYAGGTADKSVTAKDIINTLKTKGVDAHWFENRDAILPFVKRKAQKGDRVVIMGARDDTLSVFAKELLGTF